MGKREILFVGHLTKLRDFYLCDSTGYNEKWATPVVPSATGM